MGGEVRPPVLNAQAPARGSAPLLQQALYRNTWRAACAFFVVNENLM